MTDAHPMDGLDADAFLRDLRALRTEIDASLTEAEADHPRTIARWGRACTAVGLPTAGLGDRLLFKPSASRDKRRSKITGAWVVDNRITALNYY